ncbi:MAG: hypothetical protein U9Q07_04115 [Planctomycetota bacterium]|nr:hypothetical protein [Planctomycetota bacterium]
MKKKWSQRRPASRNHWFQMRLTLLEREELKIAAAFSDCSIAEYIWGLHEARSRGEIFPGGARIIRAAVELADEAEKAATSLAHLRHASPELRQKIVNLRSTLASEGRPIPARRSKKSD